MRIGIRRWQLELQLSKNKFEARIPLRLKLTFYIGIVAVIGMVLLAVVCILKSLSYTQRLMQARLSQFAAMNAQQIERTVTNQASTLLDAMQSGSLTKGFESLYSGNTTTEEWAADMEAVVKYLFSTSLLGYQAIYLYDNSESPLFYMANPSLPTIKLEELAPAIPQLLPLTSGICAQNLSQISSNQSVVLNQSAADAASASQKGAQERLHFRHLANKNSKWGSAITRSSPATSTLNFSISQEGVSSWLSQPQPLVGQNGNTTAYSYSLTIPISATRISDNIQVSQLIGYCSAIIDCSQYLYEGTDLVFNSSLLSEEMHNPWFTILEADNRRGWRYLFPTGFNFTTNSRWHAMSEFPAVAADLVLQDHQRNFIRKPGGALTHTRTPRDAKASVGYSFANLLNRQWLILLSLPQSQVEAGYRKLFKTLAGVAAAILVFVLFSAFFVTGLTTKPLLHIYNNMELRPRASSVHNSPRKLSGEAHVVSKHVADETKVLRFAHMLHANLSSRTLVSLFGSIHTDEETTVGLEAGALETGSLVDHGATKIYRKEEEGETHSSDSNDQITVTEAIADQRVIQEDLEDETSTEFHIPAPLQPLNRWISDEFDELISEYNMMVARLTAQYTKMEDKVRLRTREARASQRSAEAANLAKSKFMMNISHELLTPMNGIMGFTATTSAESDLDAIHAGLRKIIKSGVALKELLQELLNYSAHLANIEEIRRPFTIFDLAAQIRDAFATSAEAKGIQFEVRPSSTVSASKTFSCETAKELTAWQIESDYGHIQQICTNLVSNAVKFSDPRKSGSPYPQVGVHISIIQCDVCREHFGHPPGNRSMVLEVIVHDNGVGISQDRLSHVFEVFVQGDDALSKRFTGTGLGLAMSKLLCERLQGYIKVYTRANIGSTIVLRVPVNPVTDGPFPEPNRTIATTPVFSDPRGSHSVWFTDSRCSGKISRLALSGKRDTQSIEIPRQALHVALKDDAAALSPIAEYPKGRGSRPESLVSAERSSYDFKITNAGGMRVLVADDNDLLRKLLKRYLDRLGVGQVDLAATGDDVIKWVEAAIVHGRRYSIIFMDLMMPDVDGLEATRDIRRQLGYFCPVVALTGYSDNETVLRCMNAGLQKVLVKPVSQKQLAESISELVEHAPDRPQQ